ncbi:MAG: TonB-dependent receptor [Candidatus Cryptobacteroides sp.]
MKLRWFATILVALLSSIGGQARNISLKATGKPVSEIMQSIENQSGYKFFYSDDLLDLTTKVSVNISDVPIEKALEIVFSDLMVSYSIIGENIILSPGGKKLNRGGQTDKPPFRGRIVDASGAPVIGAVIVSEKDKGRAAVADIDGLFEIDAEAGEKFSVSCMGFATLEIAADLSGNVIQYVMAEDFQRLDELVVVGYGAQKRSDVTGAIASVKADVLNKTPTVSVGEMLRGAAAGVQVRMSSAEPGGSSSVLIRGRRSLSGDNAPLYIVDGVPMSGIDDINSSDIESMEILKDASSQAIYGARAANGVILITTKHGTTDKLQVSYDGYASIQSVWRNCEFYSGEEWAAYRKEAYIQAYGSYDEASCFPGLMSEVLKSGEYVDWEKLMIHNAVQHKHDILVRSGNEKTKFVFGVGGYFQDGMVMNSGFQKVSGRINIDHQLLKNLTIGANLSYSHSWKQTADGTFNTFITMPPLAKVYTDDGQTLRMDVTEAGESHYNPLWNITNSKYRTVTQRQLYNVYLDWKIVKGLSYRLNMSMNSRNVETDSYLGVDHTACLSSGQKGKSSVSRSSNNDYLVENILNYSGRFKSVHNLDATLMQSINIITYKLMGINGTDFANDDLAYNAIASAQNFGVPSYSLSERRMVSFLGRIRYNYDDRYLFSAAVRSDGSSVFGKSHKFGCFPSASFAWRLNQEAWLADVRWISNLKLRLSWGQVGNQGVSPYTTLGLAEKYLMELDGTTVGYLPDTTLPNPDLKWETSSSTNIGLDFGFFDGRLSGSLELYDTQTTDLLVYKSLSQSLGYTNQLVNMGAVQNRGVELTLNTTPVTVAGFEWDLNLSFSTNENKIKRIDGSLDENGKPANDVNNNWFIGYPVNVYYDYQFDGIWQIGDDISSSAMPDANPGDIRIKDTNLDGKIDADDRVIMKRDPDWIGSISTSFSYKGVDLSAELYASVGGTIYNKYLTSFDTGGDMTGKRNGLRRNYWTVNNPSNEAPAPNMSQQPAYITALGYQDATHVRLRNIQFGYTFPKKLISRIKMQNLRIYMTLTNMWTYTEVLGYCPEGDTGAYPEPRTVLFGLNVTF